MADFIITRMTPHNTKKLGSIYLSLFKENPKQAQRKESQRTKIKRLLKPRTRSVIFKESQLGVTVI